MLFIGNTCCPGYYFAKSLPGGLVSFTRHECISLKLIGMLAAWDDVVKGKLTATSKDKDRLIKELTAPRPKPCDGSNHCFSGVYYASLPIVLLPQTGVRPAGITFGIALQIMELVSQGKLQFTVRNFELIVGWVHSYSAKISAGEV